MYLYNNPWYVDAWNDWLGLFRGGDWFGYGFGVLVALIAAGIVAAALYGIFRLVDQFGTPKRGGVGHVLDKWIREGYWGSESYTAFGMHWEGGKYTSGPYTASRPKWVPPQPVVKVGLKEPEADDEFEVDHEDYAATKKGSPVLVIYQQGRISGTTYLRSYTQSA